MVKINKISLVAFSVFLAITVLVVALPSYEISSLQANMAANPDVPSYKFSEAIQMWKLYDATAFQPASYIMALVTVIMAIVLIITTIQMNYSFKPKS